MKQSTMLRIEQAILDEVCDVIAPNFSVNVGTRDSQVHGMTEEVVLFSIEDDFLGQFSTKEKKKLTKKLVKAFLKLAEESGDDTNIKESDKEQVILYDGGLKLMFPKSGRLNKDSLAYVEEADKNLYTALLQLNNVCYENDKILKIHQKLEKLRDKLGNFI